MKRVSTSTAVALLPAPIDGGVPGFFARPDPVNSVSATVPGHDWFNRVQEEMCYVIEANGMALDGLDNTQLYHAIKKMIQAGQRSVVIGNATFAPAVAASGKVVYWDAGNARFDLAVSDGTAKQNAVGIADLVNAAVYAFGDAVLFAGLTPGSRYYLDAVTPGAITTVAPANGVYLGIAKSATEVFVDIDAVGVSANQSNTWAKGQSGTSVPLPATTGSVVMDFTAAPAFDGQSTGNITFANGFTGPGIGKVSYFSILLTQAAAGSLFNWSFGSDWMYIGGTTAIPSQTQILGAKDEIIGWVRRDGKVSFAVRSNV